MDYKIQENFEKFGNSKFSKKNFAQISFGNSNYAKFFQEDCEVAKTLDNLGENSRENHKEFFDRFKTLSALSIF